jgi:hypothetical protein
MSEQQQQQNINQQSQQVLPELSPDVHYTLACFNMRVLDLQRFNELIVKAADNAIRTLIDENQALKMRVKQLEGRV